MITVTGFEVQDWVFPGGEVGVKLIQTQDELPKVIKVVARLTSSDWVMKLLMVKDVDGVPTLFDNVSREEEQSAENMLQTVWEDGKFIKTTSIYEIRNRVFNSLTK